MSIAVVTGSSGLVGSEAVRFLHERGMSVVGIDNHLREYFFGPDGSVRGMTRHLSATLPRFEPVAADIRDHGAISSVFRRYGSEISFVLHAAAQPSHDWAAREPLTDFAVNANGTQHLLEATREHCPDATFIYMSTNKVYGDTPNRLPRVELESRFELAPGHPFAEPGIDESMSIDMSTHSLFGVSKVAGDLLAQEYGRYFGLRTGIFRAGCLTGPAHAGAELHGFLSYLVKCVVTGRRYTIYGYGGKQVRDNIDARDLVSAFWHFHQAPGQGAVYNIGGGRRSNCSVLEAIDLAQSITGRELELELGDEERIGDHAWWISDVRKFERDHPDWHCAFDLQRIVKEIVEHTAERLSPGAS